MVSLLRSFVLAIVIVANVQISFEQVDTFSCYESDNTCSNQRVQYGYSGSNLSAAIRRCCVDLSGLSYVASESSESCSQCIVYGFFKTSVSGAEPVTAITYLEGDKEASSLSFGVVRGAPPTLRGFTFNTIDITTVPKDYVLPKSQLMISDMKSKPINLAVVDDHLALEGTELFIIRPLSSLGEGEFTQDITLSIIDNDVVSVQFSDSEYSVLESKSPAVVTVTRVGAIAHALELLITPLTFQQVPLLFNVLPEAEELLPAEYSLFGKKDFDGSQRNVSFLPSNAATESINVSIPVFDDKINQADKGFVVSLDLAGQGPPYGADTSEQNVTVVRIVNTNPLYVGFVNSSLTVREGEAINICLRILHPPPAVVISEKFRLQINLNATSLHHIVTPPVLISDPFNNTSREWCFIASINNNNAYERTDSAGYTVSLLRKALAGTAVNTSVGEAGLVVVLPSSLTLTILNINTACIGFAQSELSVQEAQGSVALSVVLLSGKISDAVTLHLRTADNTALAGVNYVQRDVDFTFNGNAVTFYVQLLASSTCASSRCFSAQLSLLDQVTMVTIQTTTANICIKKYGCGAWITDKVTDDPLFMVHLTPFDLSPQPLPALCYEVLGKPNLIYNMVSTPCVSINALYSPLDEQRNVMSVAGVVMVDSSGRCVKVQVNAEDCIPVVGGVRQSYQYNQNGVSVVWTKGLVNIGSPNCGHGSISISISCSSMSDRPILSFTLMRQLQDNVDAHGLVGQFWDTTVAIRPYTRQVPREFANDSLYLLNVTPSASANRQFLGSRFERSWDLTQMTCYYCGNIQGGRSHIVGTYDDSVIEGTHSDYVTGGLFSSNFKFSRFGLNQCL